MMEIQYSEIRRCRLCGCEEKFEELKKIFQHDPVLDLQSKIQKLLPVVVMPWDPFPHLICPKCTDKLNLFSEFYDETLKTDQFFRQFIKSAPEVEIENLDPIVQINDWPQNLKNPLKLPPNYPKLDVPDSSDKLPSPKTELAATLENFIINPISRTDSIYTCRKCFRTFIKKSSACTHKCVKVEDSGEMETRGAVGHFLGNSPSSLKNRLSSAESGKCVCNVCGNAFFKESKLKKHLKTHFVT